MIWGLKTTFNTFFFVLMKKSWKIQITSIFNNKKIIQSGCILAFLEVHFYWFLWDPKEEWMKLNKTRVLTLQGTVSIVNTHSSVQCL